MIEMKKSTANMNNMLNILTWTNNSQHMQYLFDKQNERMLIR